MHSVLSPSAVSYPCPAVAPDNPVLVDSSGPEQPPVCAVVTITNEVFKPKNARSVPPSLTDGMGGELSVVFAREYNQSEHAQQKKRWACVTTSQVVLIICGIDTATRPSDPTAFPPCVTTGLTFDQANATAEQQNAPRFEHARIPRQWTIPLKPLSTDRVW